MAFNQPLNAASAGAASNYSLTGSSGDPTYVLASSYTAGSTTVNFTMTPEPLQPGTYSFNSLSGLIDSNGNEVTPFALAFTISNPPDGQIALTTHQIGFVPGATPLPMTEVSTGFFTALGVGTFASTNDPNYWYLNANAGDHVTIRLEARNPNNGVDPYLYLENVSGTVIASTGGNSSVGNAELDNVTIPTSGTYFVDVFSNNNTASYQLRVDQSEASVGPQLDATPGGSQSNSTLLNVTSPVQGSFGGVVAGALPVGDNGDYYGLETLVAGNTISLTTSAPAISSLSTGSASPAAVELSVELAGSSAPAFTSNTGNLSYTVPSGGNGAYYVIVQTSAGNQGIRAQYLLDASVIDGVPPTVTSTGLPAPGETTNALLNQITVSFSKNLVPATVTSSANFSLTDSNGNSYALVPGSYNGGLSETLTITTGPLLPGSYTLNVGSGITDRAQNALTPFQLQFGIAQVPGFVTEKENDNSPGTATPLVTPTSQPDGTYSPNSYSVSGNQPYFTASAALRGAGQPLDLVTANYNSGTISVLLGNGNGTFQAPVTYAVGSNPIAVAIGDLNGDGKADIAVANYGSNSVSVLFGNGDGTFQTPVTYAVGSSPRGVAIADLDGKNGNDLAVANWNSANVSVLLNQGNGTFASAVNYPVGSNPGNLVIADFNGDGKLDVATANYGSNTVSILPGNGNGTFGTQITYATGSSTNPIDVVAVQLTSDGKVDLATANNGNSTVSVLLNQGTPGAAFTASTFATAVNYAAGGSSPYHLVAADLNDDGNQDLAVAGYGNNVVGMLLGNGNGTLQPAISISVGGGNPIGITAGVFNGNGVTELATANYNGNSVTVLVPNMVKALPVDATTGLESGYGRGNMSSSSDVDFFSWTGKAGDVVQVASETPGNAGNTYLNYYVENSFGSILTSFTSSNSSNNNGQGQSGPITLPYTGTYLIEVTPNSGYTGEYRFRVTEAPPTLQLVSHYNDSVSSSPNVPVLTNTSPGNLTATVAGYISQNDGSGDFFSLGNVLAGTQLNLTLSQPATSLLGGVLNIYNAAGTNETNNVTAGNTLSYTVPAGQGGTYYARVSSASTTTVSFWMNWNGTNSEMPISFSNNYNLFLNSGSFGFDTNESYVYGISSAGLANSWHLVTAVFVDGVVTNDQLWIDGVQQTLTQRVGTTVGAPLVATSTAIGNYVGGSYAFTGVLDEVAYFDGTLTAAQIQAQYAARNSGSYSSVILSQNPVAYYRLGESNGTVAYDSSGNFDNAGFGGSITLGVSGALGNDSNTAYQFSGGSISAVVPESTGLLGQYVLSIDVANTTSPQITGDTLPGQGSTSSAVIDRFTLNFSEDLNAATVNNMADYLLQDSQGNVYHMTSPGYSSGTSAGYLISDGPLQPGSYTLTISGLTDRTSNLLVPYTLSFNVTGVAPYTLESRNNNSPGTATPLVTPTSQPDGTYSPNSYSVSGNQPYFTASAALRGAGQPLDLVTANYNSGTISVLLGNGNGTFQAPVTYAVGSNPIAVAIGDLNGDGKADIAVANYGSNSVSVLFGNGDGTFQTPVTYAVGSSPRGVAIADLDGKNGNDLAVANWNSANVSVLLNQGNGTFASAVNYPVGSNPGNLVIADFNGDGKLDVATANYGSNTVSILPGNGNGTFGTQITYATGSSTNPIDVVAVQLTSDGKVDLATANNGNSTVSVLLNQGTPGAAFTASTFATAVNYAAGGSSPYHLVAADLNDDGNQDLAVAGYGNNVVGMLLGNGDGTLQPAISISVGGGNPIGITAGVFNGNGVTELATANYNGNSVTVLVPNMVKALPVDATTGLESGYGRGNMSSSSDVDFFSWTGKAGDVVQVASETPGNAGNTYLNYYVENSFGSILTSFTSSNSSNNNGQGQSGPITLPYTGTYLIEVTPNSGYTGEYRFRVTEAPPTLQLVSHYNDSVSSSPNVPVLTNTSPGNLTATVAGYISQNDGSGDFFSLGNVLAGTQLNLTLSQPATSLLGGVLNIYNAAGTNETNNVTAGNTLSYTVPAGQGGTYYARVSSASTTTVSFWMNWNGTNSEMPISFSNNYNLFLNSGSFGFDTNESYVYGISSAGLANSWHLVTAVFVDGVVTNDQLWIDGVQQTLTQRVGTTVGAPLVATSTAIGNYVGGSYAFTGVLDEVAYFDGTLTAAQIQAQYAARNSGSYSSVILSQNPVAYYRLGESNGTVAYDSSGNFDNAGFGGSITLGVSGALGNDSNTAYQFSGGSISAVVPESTGLLGQYVLSIDVANTTSPQITGDTLPGQGSTSSAVIDRFTLNFSEDLNAATVNNMADYLLQDSQGNVYHMTSPGYSSGTSAGYLISDGPLQPGSYTLTISGLTDRTSNLLVPYTLSFNVTGVAPYTLESRNNNSPGTATPLVTPTSQPDGTYSPNSYSVSGNQPYFTASAALRGAGQPLDLVTANYNSGTISVLLGNGNGTFQAPVTYAVGSNPIAVAIGDLNGDGKADIAVANYGSNSVSVLFGNGDGTFQTPVTYAVGSSPRGVAIADLDGKNGNDLAVANWNSANVSVLLNQGNGTFASAVNYPVGSNPGNLVIADFNGDGKLDVATANYGSNTVSILPGNGNGTFGTQITYATGSSTNPIDVVAVQLTSDGKVDLATANNGNSTVSVLLNQGTPGAAFTASTFATAVNYAAGGSSPYHLVAADLNDDGNQDLAVAGYGNNVVGMLLGNGDGTLQPAISISVGGGNPIGITAGVFNGNGVTELATANYNGNSVTVLVPNMVKALPVDATTGLESGYGRGNMSSSSDVDFFSWTGKAGDVVQVASETPGNAGNTYLNYYVENSFGSILTSFTSSNSSNNNGQGQSGPITLPYTGTYLIEVTPNSGYTGEYRFRVTEAPPTLQLVSHYNDSVSSSPNVPVLTNTSPGNLTATVAGYISQNDGSGDFFSLGNVLAGTQLNLTLSQPATSLLGGVLNIYNAAGTNETNNVTAGNTLSYTVPAGQGGTYYARVSSASTTTVSFWMNWNGTNSEMPISFSNNYNLFLNSGSFGFDTNESYVYGISSAGLANSWHLVTAVFVDGVVTNDQLWIDGVQQTLTQRVGTTVGAPLVATSTVIGNYVGAGYAFTGVLDEVAYFDGTLTAAQIQAQYAARNSGSYSSVILSQNPVAYYRLGESNGTVAYDSSGNFDNAGFGGSITLGVSGALGNDSNTAYQFSGGSISAVVPESTGLLGQYVLSIDVANTNGPTITAPSLPAQGNMSTSIINQVTLGFSEDLNAATVNNLANYVLQDSNGNVYHLSNPGYTSGTSAYYSITDGPLQPGSYTLTISGLTDRMGNAQNPFSLQFSVAGVTPFTNQGRSSDNSANPTALTLTGDPAGTGLFVAGGRGALINNSDVDYWTFSGTSGNSLVISTQNPNSPSGSQLNYVVTEPNGSTTLTSFNTNYNGNAESAPVNLPGTGTYTISVHISNGYYGEYRFWVSSATPPLQLDKEPNTTIATADTLSLAASGNSEVANVGGTIMNSSDLNYFNLGTVQAGYSILLSTQLTSLSVLSPVVSVYNASDVYQNKTNGRPFDSVGQIDITQTGTYYALMQGGSGNGGLLDQYVMNVQIVPTSSLTALPNLEVTSISLPSGSNIESGQPVTFSWTVTNDGQAATNVDNWSDRAVLSLDTTYGNSDDIPLGGNNGVFGHSGVLAVGQSYTATETVMLPDGISGNYYIIVQTDTNEQVDESTIGRGDSVTVSSGGPNGNGTFTVNLAPYADLIVQGLTVNGPSAAGSFSLSWDTVNQGDGAVANNWAEQLVVKDVTTGVTVVNTPLSFSGGLAANGGTSAHTEPFTGSYTVDSAGDFDVSVTTNSDQSIYEDNLQGHASAVANDTSATTFTATRDLTVTNLTQSSPASPQSGNPVTLTWTDADTGVLATTGGWSDQVTVVNTTTGAALYSANVPYTGASIQPGSASATLSTSFTLPDGAPGVGTIEATVTVNANHAEAEYNTAGTAGGNNSSSINFASTLADYADLIVAPGSLGTAPTDPRSSGAVTVTWNDQNQGDAAVSAAFNDSVLVQKVNSENSLTTIATGTVSGNASLAAGATSAQQQFNFTLPEGPAGVGNFLITVTTDSGQTVKEYDSNGNPAYGNNSASITTTSTLGNSADLIVAPGSVTATPTNPYSSGAVTVTWNDENQGLAAVNAAFNDSVLLQKVNSGNSLTTVASGTVSGDATLAAGAISAQQQLTLALPDGVAGVGNFLITVTTDSGKTVAEYDSNGNPAYGNNSASITTTSTLGRYADLVVSPGSVAATPTNPYSSGAVTVTWNDENQGDAAVSAAFNDSVLVQKVNSGNSLSTIATGTVSGNATLAAGATSDQQQLTIALPDGAAGVGNFLITVTTDSGQTVKEFDSNGNPAYGNNSSSITITSTLGNYADLVVASGSLAVTPATPQSSGAVTVTWNDTNQGDAAVSAAFNDYVLVQRVNPDNSLTNITSGNVSGNASLAVGATSAQQEFSFTLPDGPAGTGNFQITVTTDSGQTVKEYDGSGNPAYGNNSASITTKSTLAAYPDLQVTMLSATPSAGLQSGGDVTLSWDDANTGNGATKGSWYDSITVTNSTTGEVLGTSTLLYDPSAAGNGPIAAGDSRARQFMVTLPNGAPGVGQIQFSVTTNVYNQVFEYNTAGPNDTSTAQSNNTSSLTVSSTLAPYPDLTVPSLIVSPSTGLESGDNLSIQWSDSNTGNAPVNGAFIDHVVIQNTTTGKPLGTQDVPYDPTASGNGPIAAGQAISRQIGFTLPQGTPGAGQIQVTVTTDYYNQVFEWNEAGPGGTSTAESNNSTSQTVTASLAPYADLAASAVSAPSLTIGDPAQVTVGWTVTNQGNGPGTVATWTDAVIASPDDDPTDGTTIAQFTHQGLLAVGASYSQTQTFLLPPHFEGQYHLFVETNSTGAVFENGNTANNYAEAPNLFDVSPIPYADLVVPSVTVSPTGASGQPVQISWTVANQGIGVTNTSSWSDEVSLATDPAGTNIVVDLGGFEHIGVLAPGGSYTHTVEVTLPVTLQGTYYVVVHTGGPYEFIYTTNNTNVSGPLTVTLTPAPDLTPTQIVAPTTAGAGDQVDVSWTVQNLGPGDANTPWTDSLQLRQVGGGAVYNLGQFSYTLPLQAGKSYSRDELVGLPSNVQGVFQFAVTTATGLFENGATANDTYVDPNQLTLTLPPNPDLQVLIGDSPLAG